MEQTRKNFSILKDSCTMTDAFKNFKNRCAALPSPFEGAKKIQEVFPEIADAVLKNGADGLAGFALLPGTVKNPKLEILLDGMKILTTITNMYSK